MNKDTINRNFGENLRFYRKRRKMSQQELAAKANISTIYYGRVERGERCPTLDTLFKLCSALNIYPYEMLNFSAEPIEVEAIIAEIRETHKSLDKHKQESFLLLLSELCTMVSD